MKHMDLKCLMLHMSYYFDWDDEGELNKLPPKPATRPSRLASIDLSGINLADPQQYFASYFNPSTLRKLELRDCPGYEYLLLALSKYADIANMDEIVIVSWEKCEESSVLDFVTACKKLKTLSLDLSSFTEESMIQLLPAIVQNKETLEVLSITLRDDHDWHGESLYYSPKALGVLRSFERLRELGMSYAISPVEVREISRFSSPPGSY
jgi:hypothetical protein